MFRVSSKEGVFYDLFVEAVRKSIRAAKLLESLMINYTNVPEKVREIEEIEHECDIHIHKIFEHLNRSFITPIDREDIYSIAKELDNITDDIESVAHRFTMFSVTSIREDALKLARLIVECTEQLEFVMAELKNMKKSQELKKRIIEVNRLENEGDKIFRQTIVNLFENEKNAVEVIKWKEIYELLETTLDVCEDVADIVEGIVMKHA